MASDDAGKRSVRVIFLNNEFAEFWMNFPNCEIFEYVCRTAETVSELGKEAFEKKRIVV